MCAWVYGVGSGIGFWEGEIVGGVGFAMLLLYNTLLLNDYNAVGGGTGNKVVNNNSNTTTNTVVNKLVNGNGKTTVKTTMNTTMNANTNITVKRGVSGGTTRTTGVRNTRIRRMASTGNLPTIGMSFTTNVLFNFGSTTLDGRTGTSLHRLTRVLGRSPAASVTVVNRASGINACRTGVGISGGHTCTMRGCLRSYNMSPTRFGGIRNIKCGRCSRDLSTSRGQHMRMCVCTDRRVVGGTRTGGWYTGIVGIPVYWLTC